MRNWHLFRCKVLAHKACGSVPLSENIKPFNTPHGLLGIVIHKDAILGVRMYYISVCYNWKNR